MSQYTLLFYNLGYCAGLNGSWRSYALHWHRQLFTRRAVQAQTEQAIVEFLLEHEPDVCCFAEVTEDSLQRIQAALSDTYEASHFANKYGQRSLFRYLPPMSSKGNGVLSKRHRPVRERYLSSGVKKLVLEVDCDHFSLFTVHCSLGSAIRQKQFAELSELIPSDQPVVLCGDFNIFNGLSELENLIRATRLRIASEELDGTFPAVQPKNTLDMFLSSSHIEVSEYRVVESCQVSDHLPVLFRCSVLQAAG